MITIIYTGLLLWWTQLRVLLVVVIILELLSWTFVTVLKDLALKYLVIQRLFALISLGALVWWPRALMWVVIFKLGLPPLHSWIAHILAEIKAAVFVFFTTIHKLYAIYVLGLVFFMLKVELIGFVSLFIRLILIFNVSTLFLVLIFSSFIHRAWMIVGFNSGIGFVWFYWLRYTLLLLRLLNVISEEYLVWSRIKQSWLIGLLWLFLSGIPPFTLFWLKLNIIGNVVATRLLLGMALLFLLIISLSSYFRAFSLSLATGATWVKWLLPIIFLVSFLVIY